LHQRRWKWLRWNQKKRGRRHRFFSTSKSRPLLLVLCLRVVFSMLPFLVNSDVFCKRNLLPATSSRRHHHLCCCCCCCCSQASSKIPSSLSRKRERACTQSALWTSSFARFNPPNNDAGTERDAMKSKERCETHMTQNFTKMTLLLYQTTRERKRKRNEHTWESFPKAETTPAFEEAHL